MTILAWIGGKGTKAMFASAGAFAKAEAAASIGDPKSTAIGIIQCKETKHVPSSSKSLDRAGDLDGLNDSDDDPFGFGADACRADIPKDRVEAKLTSVATESKPAQGTGLQPPNGTAPIQDDSDDDVW